MGSENEGDVRWTAAEGFAQQADAAAAASTGPFCGRADVATTTTPTARRGGVVKMKSGSACDRARCMVASPTRLPTKRVPVRLDEHSTIERGMRTY